MDEKDKFDGIDGEQEEAVYVARHARRDEEEDRFADVENFDVDSTEPESVQDGTEGKDDYTDSYDSYGDDFNFQSVASKSIFRQIIRARAIRITAMTLTVRQASTGTSINAESRIMMTIM